MENQIHTISESSKPIKKRGRPRSIQEDHESIGTRLPESVQMYIKGISPFMGKNLMEIHQVILKEFIARKPWNNGLEFRKPKSASKKIGADTQIKTGWTPVSITLPKSFVQELKLIADSLDVSASAFVYTAIYYWIQYLYPPNKLMKHPHKSVTSA